MTISTILHNQRGQEGKSTSAVVVVQSFMNALFNIEKDFHTQEKYTVSENADSKEYLLHHVTNADLQFAIILQKVCNTLGYIRNVFPHDIYRKICEYFETPIVESQFYASLTKFLKHKLIEKKKDPYTGRYDFKLNHYLHPETGKVGFFVLLPPLVFTEEFTKLDLAKKKLFYSVYIQQQSQPVLERLLENVEAKDVQFSGLFTFLHRDTSQLKRLMAELTTEPIFHQVPLFKKAELLKYRGKYYKAILAIHPDIQLKGKDNAGEKYHDVFTSRHTYPRVLKLITSYLHAAGIGEVAAIEGETLNQLVSVLKRSGARVIRYAIDRLKEFFAEKGVLPSNIVGFVKNEVKLKTKAAILGIVRKHKLQSFVVPHCQSRTEKLNREDEFASVLSHLPLQTLERICRVASRHLHAGFTRPSSTVSYRDYSMPTGIERPEIIAIRHYAFLQKKDPQEYILLEMQAAKKAREMDSVMFREWMMDQVNDLPNINSIPAVERDFKLEQYILRLT
ncbi:hypothetical protein [Aneurinibacillus terranovensis]|uniref:hypothetical protein n=1 Tax=Aneurinibacillus terranovensis TaxID=278991 RepID=UPI000426E587|nr:hypothetical protein [Aneurinibacillus terranovensis]